MGTISSSVGLATGMDIAGTVDALISIEGKRRDNLEEQTVELAEEQYAITELAALLMSVSYVGQNFGKETVFEQRAVSSSNENAIVATKTGEPLDGTYSFTPISLAQNQQMLSQGFESDSQALGGGNVSIRFGNDAGRSMSLNELNGGRGIERGMIRVTDRSGATALIDLSAVTTVDDVLDAINGASSINVTAVAKGDHFEIVDNTGRDGSLMVQDVSGGTTAAWLGLDGINTTDAVGVGRDIVYLSRETPLAILNDLNGVERHSILSDIDFCLHDATLGKIDFSSIKEGATEETTLGDILDAINAAAPGKLVASISPDGDRILLEDTTIGSASFVVGSMNDSPALKALGLDGLKPDANDVMTGRRIQGGLQTVLMSSLNGGKGFHEQFRALPDDASVDVTTSQGTVTINLTQDVLNGVETLDDLMDVFNSAGASIGLSAELNEAKTGIQLRDSTMGSSAYLKVEDVTGDFAGILGLAGESENGLLGTGDMHLKTVSTEMKLSDYNGGAGVSYGTIYFQDSAGEAGKLVLNSEVETVGDLLSEINHLGIGIYAEINENGDGIRIVDTADGEGTLKIAGDGFTKAASDLHLLGEAKEVEIDGEMFQVVDGSSTITIELGEDDTLDDLRQKINDLEMDVYASTFVDGSSSPYRLSLLSQRSGSNGRMVVDMSELGISMSETVEARDAVMIYGNRSMGGNNVMVTSSTNEFKSVVSGISLEIKQATGTPVTVRVEPTHTDLIATMSTFVTNYNNFRDALEEYTYYDELNGEGSVLTADATARRLDDDMSFFLTQQFHGAGSISLLSELGVRINDQGKLEFNQAEFEEKLAEDPEAVRTFFLGQSDGTEDAENADDGETDDVTNKTGFFAEFTRITESLVGQDNSAVATRFTSLQNIIERNQEKIEWWNEKLEVQRERLYMQFYRMEIAVAKIQSNQSAISSIQALTVSSDSDE